MKIRLQKYLSQCGIASRREAEELIWEGRVKVNGRRITEMGVKIDPTNDDIRVGRIKAEPLQKVYFLLNKPEGFVTTVKDRFAKLKVTDLLPPALPVYPIGRLDKETTGLLILTNDGELTNLLTSPKNKIEKEYTVICQARWPELNLNKAIKHLEAGVLITGYRTRPAKVTKLQTKDGMIFFNITIHEGKNRQIRRMCHNVGMKVRKLKRIRIGGLKLGNLKVGQYRKIKKEEIIETINGK